MWFGECSWGLSLDLGLLAWTIWIWVGTNRTSYRCSFRTILFRFTDIDRISSNWIRTRSSDSTSIRRLQFQSTARTRSRTRPQPLYLNHQTSAHFLQIPLFRFPTFLLSIHLIHLGFYEHKFVLHSFIIALEGSCYFLQADVGVDLVGFVLT
jgi:hypothetical protein